MTKSEVIYQDALRAPLDNSKKGKVEKVLGHYLRKAPIKITYAWDEVAPCLHVKSKLISWKVDFGPEDFIVTAKVSLMGRFLDTPENRETATGAIEELRRAIGV